MTRWLLVVAAVGSIGALACSDNPNQNPVPMITMRYAGGSGQTGTVGSALPEKLAVRVVRGTTPVPGVLVEWDLAGEMDRTTTDGEGIATMTWTLPTTIGNHNASATLERSELGPLTVKFQALAAPGPPSRVRGPPDYYAYVADQVGVIGAPLTMDYMAVVTDDHGNVLPEVELQWKVTSGGGSVEAQPPYDGYQYARHTLGTSPGTNTVIATSPLVPGHPSVTFTATGVHALVLVGEQNTETVLVHVGETVGWQWGRLYDYEYDMGPPAAHNVVFEDAPSTPESATERRFGVHTRTFHQMGIYRYRCTLHSTDFEQGHIGQIGVLP